MNNLFHDYSSQILRILRAGRG